MKNWIFVCSSCLIAMLQTIPVFSQPARFLFTHGQMGTEFRIVMYTSDSTQAALAAQEAFDRIDELNHILSDYDPESELNALSATSGSNQSMKVSEDLWEVLSASKMYAEATAGAFDITVGPIVRLWRRARKDNEYPPAYRLEEAMMAVGHEKIKLIEADRNVLLTTDRMRLDLGGIAKGFAAQEAYEILLKHNILNVIIDAGGDLVLGDPPPGRDGWEIAVDMLNHEGEIAQTNLMLKNVAVATSGDTYRYVEIEGKRYSHIVNPKTGVGMTDSRKVTVIATTGMQADALASALSVMNIEEGLNWVNNKKNCEALIIKAENDLLIQQHSLRFQDYIAPK